jgi:hypothetical protein
VHDGWVATQPLQARHKHNFVKAGHFVANRQRGERPDCLVTAHTLHARRTQTELAMTLSGTVESIMVIKLQPLQLHLQLLEPLNFH